MRIPVLLFLLSFSAPGLCQSSDFQLLLDSAKQLFHKGVSSSSKSTYYKQVAEILQEAVNMNPCNAEARYYLGYSLSKMNSKDGNSLIDVNRWLTQRASEQFEAVIEISPRYYGQLIPLDPYTKISSEWGSLAMAYLYAGRADSAYWAFREGKSRGGFGDYTLRIIRESLDACDPNSILISSGDIFTMGLWYVQKLEGYRPDIGVADAGLLNAKWYPLVLNKTTNISFSMTFQEIDQLSYVDWKDSTMSINGFEWTLSPSYHDQYLLPADLLLLDILKTNNFERDVNFTSGFDPKGQLSLGQYLSSRFLVDELNPYAITQLSKDEFYKTAEYLLKLTKYINPNSQDELRILNVVRTKVMLRIYYLKETEDSSGAKELLGLLDKYANENKYPYDQKVLSEYLMDLREGL